ncbi:MULTISPECIES: EAL and HDOD domain-containing protein [unclassified Marinimicrobium]|jgi:EAL and modified HD-GYP domain-containing signal transduction protein|uniref:EAL and HDOD domain-containing protein n=1 Tax=unclassified Marinimicrobium TaxID=2632100 RepID=UPI00257DC844|nr:MULTISPECIES: HDOD domain-containing protein [unclassified Marinimicrobium]
MANGPDLPADDSDSELNVLLAAQPIYDRENAVAGVELLYRNDEGQTAFDVGERNATNELLFNFCTGVSDQIKRYQAPAFINVSRSFLCSGAFLPIDPGRVVVELVERIDPDAEVIEAVRRWHQRGFSFALDDFEFKPEWEPLLRMSSIIKVDVEKTPFHQALTYRKQLSHYPVRWLAERIETPEDHQRFYAAGFDLFQGYFFARPKIIHGKKLSPAALNVARLIGLLYALEPDIDRITQVLSEDPMLSVSLIRIVNSPLYKTRQEVSSLKEVVMRMGILAIRRWVLLISSLQGGSPEKVRLILVRAQACAALSEYYRGKPLDSGRAFLAGLLSGADVMLGVDLPTFLDALDISSDVKAAALTREGGLGKVVDVIERLERRLAMKQDLSTVNRTLVRLYEQSAQNVQALFNHV